VPALQIAKLHSSNVAQSGTEVLIPCANMRKGPIARRLGRGLRRGVLGRDLLMGFGPAQFIGDEREEYERGRLCHVYTAESELAFDCK